MGYGNGQFDFGLAWDTMITNRLCLLLSYSTRNTKSVFAAGTVVHQDIL